VVMSSLGHMPVTATCIPGPAGRHSVWRFAVEIKASSPSHVQRVNDRLIPCMWSSIDTLCGSYFFFWHSPSFIH
jgi:hypothetical protein